METRTRFVILRHAAEVPKSSNTGRLAALALTRAELWDWGMPGVSLDESVLQAPGTWVLFPDRDAPQCLEEPPQNLVVLDGSWPQALRMLHRIAPLRSMPRLRLPHKAVVARRLRQSPRADAMSTLEAVARAVALLEGEEKARPLEDLYALMVQRVLETRGTCRRRRDDRPAAAGEGPARRGGDPRSSGSPDDQGP